jgi:hypothetical protein
MCDEVDIGTGADYIAHIIQYRTCDPRPQARPIAGKARRWDGLGRSRPAETFFEKVFERAPPEGAMALLIRSVKSAFALLSQKVTKARLTPERRLLYGKVDQRNGWQRFAQSQQPRFLC